MRKTMFYVAQYIAGIALLYLTFLITPSSHFDANEGFEEDIVARSEWERIRLCDPATGRIPQHMRERELEFAKRFQVAGKSINLQERTFQEQGPFNVGGRTRAVAIDVSNTNVIIAGGVSGGIWRTTDGGSSWTKSSSPSVMHNITTIAQDTRVGKRNIWYAGTGEIWGNSSELNGTGLYKSTDGGLTWTLLNATKNSSLGSWDSQWEFIWRVVVDHTITTQDVVYAATVLGAIQRSTDGGTTWKTVLGGFGNNYGYFSDVAITKSGVLYATISQQAPGGQSSIVKGIFRSTDGVKWTSISPSFIPTKYARIVMGTSETNENTVYFLANTPGSGFKQIDFQGREDWNSLWRYTYQSGDGSGTNGTWVDLSENIPGLKATQGQFGDFQTQGSYDMYVKVKPDDPNTIFIGGTNVYRSTDGFTTKTKWNWCGGYLPGSNLPFYGVYENNHPDQHDLIFYPDNPNKMICACDGGLFRCDDPMAGTVKWSSLNNGYRTSQFYTCAIDHSTTNNKTIIGGLQDNGTVFTNSTNSKANWASPGLGDGSYCAIAKNGMYYMSRQQGRIGRFELDANGNVQKYTRIDPKGVPKDDYLFINPFVLDPTDNNIMYLPAKKILWRCSDLTLTPWGSWDTNATSSMGWDSLPQTRIDTVISAVGVTSFPAHRVYYGTQNGKLYRLDSANVGNPKPVLISPTNFPTANIECIAVNPRNADSVVVVFSNYNVQSLYFTQDGGKTWTAIGGNLEGTEGPSCRWVEMVDVNGKMMYFVGTSIGLFSSSYLSGTNTVWEQEGASTIGNNVVSMIDIRSLDKFIVVATHGNGVYTGTVNQLTNTPGAISLSSPANNETCVTTRATLTWQTIPDAVYYQIELSTSPTFATTEQIWDAITTNEVIADNLVQGHQQYYWRVRGFNAGGPGAYSQTWSFTTALLAPTLVTPIQTSTPTVLPARLVWHSISKATSYKIQVSPSLTFSTVVFEKETSDTTIEVTGLEKGKTYRWRVMSKENTCEGTYSSSKAFATEQTSDVTEPQNIIVTNVSVWPHPVQNTSTIDFMVLRNSMVECSVFNLQGTKVATLFNGYLPSGNHAITLQSNQLVNGNYLVHLTCNGTIFSKPIIIAH